VVEPVDVLDVLWLREPLPDEEWLLETWPVSVIVTLVVVLGVDAHDPDNVLLKGMVGVLKALIVNRLELLTLRDRDAVPKLVLDIVVEPLIVPET